MKRPSDSVVSHIKATGSSPSHRLQNGIVAAAALGRYVPSGDRRSSSVDSAVLPPAQLPDHRLALPDELQFPTQPHGEHRHHQEHRPDAELIPAAAGVLGAGDMDVYSEILTMPTNTAAINSVTPSSVATKSQGSRLEEAVDESAARRERRWCRTINHTQVQKNVPTRITIPLTNGIIKGSLGVGSSGSGHERVQATAAVYGTIQRRIVPRPNCNQRRLCLGAGGMDGRIASRIPANLRAGRRRLVMGQFEIKIGEGDGLAADCR